MNAELKKIFDEDQTDRKLGKDWSDEKFWQAVSVRDKERRARVQEIINEGGLKNGEDYYHAGMIFQHGGTPEDYLKANKLAKKGSELGNKNATWLVAASWDRYLINTGHKFQKYGTQYKRDKEGGWYLYPVDPATTDEERKAMGVDTLEETDLLE